MTQMQDEAAPIQGLDMPRVEPDSGMSKTLHNGLEILELLAAHPNGLSVSEIAEGIGVHRTVAHRLIRTLEAHRLCRRDDYKRVALGAGLVTLSESVEQDLRTLARPILEDLADTVEATAHLVVRESDTTVRAMMVIEPRRARCTSLFVPARYIPSIAAPRASRYWHLCPRPPMNARRWSRHADSGTRSRRAKSFPRPSVSPPRSGSPRRNSGRGRRLRVHRRRQRADRRSSGRGSDVARRHPALGRGTEPAVGTTQLDGS